MIFNDALNQAHPSDVANAIRSDSLDAAEHLMSFSEQGSKRSHASRDDPLPPNGVQELYEIELRLSDGSTARQFLVGDELLEARKFWESKGAAVTSS